MIIKQLELNNFRIYHGTNIINLEPTNRENIFIVSGKNGFGKTTFLMSLVWCLYGKQMQEVDDLYYKEIKDQGNYNMYIANSLNRLAKSEGETKFSVSITFGDVDIADVPCKEIKITRSYNIHGSTQEDVEILLDGYKNELTKEVGHEIFIRDFLLPKEIAKFFFFDAEKIVTLAEVNTTEQSKKLSEAYSEVLGIKKYLDLQKELESLQLKLRQDSASAKEKTQLVQLQADVEKCELEIDDKRNTISEKREEKNEKSKESRDIQEKLIRAGSSITVEELNRLINEEVELSSRLEGLNAELKSLFDDIPFAIAGDLLLDVSGQLEDEKNFKTAQYKEENIKETTGKILTDLLDVTRPKNLAIDHNVHQFYTNVFEQLIRKHFFDDAKELPEDFKVIHDYSDTQINEMNTFISNIKVSFKDTFRRISGDVNQVKSELNSIRRKIRDAEAKKEDPIIAEYRMAKEELDKAIIHIESTIDDLNQEIGELQNDKTQKGKRIEEISKKLKVAEKNKDKDKLAGRLIQDLKQFIESFKSKKKESLEKQILEGLQTLMHKKGFIKKVEVDILGELIDIILYDARGDKIKKESLSKGEQQMYATALLKGLVEESNIDFPVFIDSPMQKFDEQHAQNIIKYFYPNISEQVVIFPLINKEITSTEFEFLKKKVAKTYLINNVSNDRSEFLEVEKKKFLDTYNKMYNNAN